MMLKRQRPSTPPPSLATIPSSSDFGFGERDVLVHGAKRRRVVAPVLDGRERGLQASDDDWIDEEQDDFDVSDSAAEGSVDYAPQYKETNTLLYQLHLEHQRRSRFLPLDISSHDPRNNDSTPSSPGQPAKHPPLIAAVRFPEDRRSPSVPSDSSNKEISIREELSQVRARYEEQNRLLGSLVRKRKQELGLSTE